MTVTTAVLAVLLALVFVGAGSAKILAVQPMRDRAAEVGFSTTAYRGIGVLEVAGAIGLLLGSIVPAIGALAGVGLLLLLGGAVVTHVRNGDGPRKFAPAVVCGLLVAGYLVALFAATS
jgi:hypothetical protein